jgi:hypothetical protein
MTCSATARRASPTTGAILSNNSPLRAHSTQRVSVTQRSRAEPPTTRDGHVRARTCALGAPCAYNANASPIAPPPYQRPRNSPCGAHQDHRPARTAPVPSQPHQDLHGRLVWLPGATHLALHQAMPHHHHRPAQRPCCSPAARAYARPRCRARRHRLAPGLDPERACDESMGASFSFDGCEARRERARPSKETPSSVTNFWLVLSFRAAAYTRVAALNIPRWIQPAPGLDGPRSVGHTRALLGSATRRRNTQ